MMSNDSSGFEFSSIVSYFMLDSIPGLILPPGSRILLNFSISSLLNFAFSSSLRNGSAIAVDNRHMVKINPRRIDDVFEFIMMNVFSILIFFGFELTDITFELIGRNF